MLEKLLEEIERLQDIQGWDLGTVKGILDIIRKHMNDGWIPVEERLPEGEINPITQDFFCYQVTVDFGDHTDVRNYKFGNSHWWLGPMKMDKYVTAWRERPEPYRPEKQGEQNN